MSSFGGKGYFVQTPEELQAALKASLEEKHVPFLINVMIDPQSDRKKQVCPFYSCKVNYEHLPCLVLYITISVICFHHYISLRLRYLKNFS